MGAGQDGGYVGVLGKEMGRIKTKSTYCKINEKWTNMMALACELSMFF